MSTVNKVEGSIPIPEIKNDNKYTTAFENGPVNKIALEAYFTFYNLNNGILCLEGKLLDETWKNFEVTVKKFKTKPESKKEWNEGYLRLEYNNIWYVVDITLDNEENLKPAINFPYYNYLPPSIYAQIIGAITADL